MKQPRLGRKAIAVALLGVLGTGTAAAQSLDVSETVGTINQTDHPSQVVFTNTDPATIGAFDFELFYDETNLTITDADITTSSAGTACSVPTPGRILCFANPTAGTTLPATITINLPFDIGGAVDIELLTFGTVAAFDSGGGSATLTLDEGQIDVQAAPPDVNLSYNPASGSTVTFGGGTSGNPVTASITVSATGTTGTGSVTGCSLGGANAGAFSVDNSFPITLGNGESGTIDLTCNLGNSAATATLTCTESDANSQNATFNLSCPAGTPVPAPEFTSTPASGGTVSCNGAPGSTTSTSITIQNTGFAGTGSDLTYSCSTASAGFAISSGASGTVPVGGSSTVMVSCTVPMDGTATGTVDCSTNDADEPTATYTVSAGAVTVPPPVPGAELIPANSLWSKLALFGLLAGLGALVIGMRRH